MPQHRGQVRQHRLQVVSARGGEARAHLPGCLGRGQDDQLRVGLARQLEALVWQDLCDLLTHPERIAQALARAHGGGWLPQELQARREQLREGQRGLERQLERLTEAYLLAVVPLAEYQRRRQALEQRLQAMTLQAEQLEA